MVVNGGFNDRLVTATEFNASVIRISDSCNESLISGTLPRSQRVHLHNLSLGFEASGLQLLISQCSCGAVAAPLRSRFFKSFSSNKTSACGCAPRRWIPPLPPLHSTSFKPLATPFGAALHREATN